MAKFFSVSSHKGFYFFLYALSLFSALAFAGNNDLINCKNMPEDKMHATNGNIKSKLIYTFRNRECTGKKFIQISPNGSYIITNGLYGVTVLGREEESWQPVIKIPQICPSAKVRFSSDGNYIITVSDKTSVKIFKMTERGWEYMATVTHPLSVNNIDALPNNKGYLDALFAFDEQYFLTYSPDNVSKIWQIVVKADPMNSEDCLTCSRGNEKELSQKDAELVYISEDFKNTTTIVDLYTLVSPSLIKLYKFSPDKKHLVLASENGEFSILWCPQRDGVWEKRLECVIGEKDDDDKRVNVVFSPDGLFLFIHFYSTSTNAFRLLMISENDKGLKNINLSLSFPDGRDQPLLRTNVSDITFSPGNHHCAIKQKGQIAVLTRIKDSWKQTLLMNDLNEVFAITFSSDGVTIVVVSEHYRPNFEGTTLRMFEYLNSEWILRKKVLFPDYHYDPLRFGYRGLIISPNGNFVALRLRDDENSVIKILGRDENGIWKYEGELKDGQRVEEFQFFPNDDRILTFNYEDYINIWEMTKETGVLND